MNLESSFEFRLSKPWVKWLTLGILTLVITIIRLPTFWEFLWYGDENIYLAVGHGLANGQRLYQEVWDNKPPLLYLFYWLSYQIAGVDVWGFRLLNLGFSLVGLFAFWGLVYNLCRNLFKIQYPHLTTWFSSIFFGLFLALGWEMGQFNAENLYMPLIILGLYFWSLTFTSFHISKYVGIGICFSLACLTKIHAIVEIAFLIYLMIWQSLESRGVKNIKSIKSFFKYHISRLGLVIGLIILPYIGIVVWYLSQGLGGILYYSILGFGSSYVAKNSPLILGLPIFGYPNSLISNLQFRVLLIVILTSGLSLLRYRKLISYQYFFATLWLGVCFFGAMISERNYPHYLIQVFGSVSLLIGLVLNYLLTTKQPLVQKLQSLISIILILNLGTIIFGSSQIVPIYQPDIWYRFSKVLTNNMSLDEFQRSNNAGAYDRAKRLVPIITKYSTQKDKIYLVANSPELYLLSNRLSGHRQITDFQYDTSIQEVYQELITNQTKLIIVDKNSPAKSQFDKLLSQDYVEVFVQETGDDYQVWLKAGS